MFSLNRAQIIGNLTRDPELRVTPNGQSVASFAVATNRRWTNADGTQQDDTQYHEIVCWGKLAEIAQQIFSKGKKAYVEGRLQTRSWEAPDGTKRNKTEIVAENLIALSPRDGSTGSESAFPGAGQDGSESKFSSKPTKGISSPKKGATKDSDASQAPSDDDDGEIKLEDIPF